MTATMPRVAMSRAAGVGAAVGAGSGVLAQFGMRLIGIGPGLSGTGAFAVVGLAALFGCGVGLVTASGRAGLAIVWLHIRACRADLRARRVGDLYAERTRGNQIIVRNDHRAWRLQ